ncbi:MAG: FtsX-like permease family protein [Bacteroidales bacterium]|nr:FtsX-like permease family protein [Candidatus Cryptobacteroides caccocaballi]
MNLPFFIARRYLFAKKSHNVINIISTISSVGMAIGTAALIIILSVYNGFDELVRSMMGTVEPDLLVVPSEGKAFIPEGEAYDWLYDQESVASVCTVLQEQVFLNYAGKQSVVIAKGVDQVYEEESPLESYIREGEYRFHRGDVPLALVGAGLAYKMGISPRFLTPIEIYFPTRTRAISLANPTAAIRSVKVWPSATFAVSSEIDNAYMLLPIDQMRNLLEYEDEVSGVEIRFTPGTHPQEVKRVQKELGARLGDGLQVRDRYQQNESLYKMMKYEKAAIFLILIFVIIIIAFNIFGSLSMLIIDKRGDMETLRSMGATDSLVRRIFVLEGWFISLLGLAGGLVVGILVCLVQQHFGIIKMPGSFIVQAYPIVLSWTDILITVAGVAIVGYLIALLPVASFYRKERR